MKPSRLKSLLTVGTGAVAVAAGYSFYKDSSAVYEIISKHALPKLDAEKAHVWGVRCAKWNWLPKSTYQDPKSLSTSLCGLQLSNPIGLAAGLDKNGEAVTSWENLGFGFVEVGTVTPKPQPGNPQPRVFRLPEHRAIINRYGFNSQGSKQVLENLKSNKGSENCILGINIGVNKNSANAVDDYLVGVNMFGPVADYLVLNVSSPNTPGLRDLQNKVRLKQLLQKVTEMNSLFRKPPKVFVKIAPDLSHVDAEDIADVVLSSKIDALIVSNTTISRPDSIKDHPNGLENGGLSGAPLKEMSTALVKDMYRFTKGAIPIVAVGGVETGKDAYEKIRAGATAVQLYTGLIYHGPFVVERIKKELAGMLEADGFSNVSELIGADIELSPQQTERPPRKKWFYFF